MYNVNGALGHDSALIRLYWAGTTWANEMNLVMNHAPDARSIARPVDQQSSALCHGYLSCNMQNRVRY